VPLKFTITALLLLLCTTALCQQDTMQHKGNAGIITGNIVDGDNGKGISEAVVRLSHFSDTAFVKIKTTLKDGYFLFEQLPHGYYRLFITHVGYTSLRIDSFYIRAERFDFDLNDIKLHKSNTRLEEVIVYAEKPLIESKDGKIIFNAGESALSAGATATELLKQTPLVSTDADGKVQVRGKDVKILIDDKPVELNAKQLQDLLESMPGSMIDKIEVMTTPPPQYANERGGVINIVTKKGRVGKSARLNLSYGTRGEAGISGNATYRKNKVNLSLTIGFGYNQFAGNSYSNRQNIYTDSINYFNTVGNTGNSNRRPNARFNIDYEFNKHNSISFTAQYNANNAFSNNNTEFRNINRLLELYRLSNRLTATDAQSHNPNLNATYTHKGKNVRELMRIIATANFTNSNNTRDYYQQFLNADYSFTGTDSTQQQITSISSHTYSLRVNYDKPLAAKWLLSTGVSLSMFGSHNTLNTFFLKKPDNVLQQSSLLSNDFRFYQNIFGVRAALRYDVSTGFYITAGAAEEKTNTWFNFATGKKEYNNNYYSLLPFATVQKKWRNEFSVTFSYKRTIQRPGINELNPGVDYTDPYNTRFGNPFLQSYTADNFDLIVGQWHKTFYINGSVGYNALQNIYSQLRTLQTDGKTTITWQNISGRKEYEANAWGGITVSKKVKANISLGYTYNVYSSYDKTFNKFRNGGSFFSTLNGSYQFTDVFNASSSCTFNRFANPQGTVRNTLSMNIGVQRKFFNKKMIVAFNAIDPLRQQQNKNFTTGKNFTLENFSTTNTRNFRIALSYIFNNTPKKKTGTQKVPHSKKGS
jgi:hypothetical protein